MEPETMQSLHLGPKVRILNQSIHSYMDHELEKLELTAIQSFILRYLEKSEGPVYAKDIEKRFDLAHPTVSGILQRMEAKGFLLLEEDRTDRRRKQVRATEKAARAGQQIHRSICSMEQALLRDFSPEERELLITLLDRASGNLRKFDKEEHSL